MLINLIITTISAFLSLFIFWYRLKEDYTQNQIFTTGFYILLGITIGSIFSDNFIPEWWFWLSFIGALLGLSFGIIKYKLRIYETTEAMLISLMLTYISTFISDYIKETDIKSLIATFIILLLMILFFVFDKHYKRFSWYRSGRVGFSGFTISGIFFLIRSVVAASFNNVLSFVGDKDVILSGIFSFISFLVVFNLSRQKV